MRFLVFLGKTGECRFPAGSQGGSGDRPPLHQHNLAVSQLGHALVGFLPQAEEFVADADLCSRVGHAALHAAAVLFLLVFQVVFSGGQLLFQLLQPVFPIRIFSSAPCP